MGAIFIAGVLEGRRGFNGLRIMTIISVWFLSWPLLISISAGLMAFCTQTPSLPDARDLGKEATLLTSWLAAGYNSSALALVSIHQALMGRPVVLMCHVAGCNAQLPLFWTAAFQTDEAACYSGHGLQRSDRLLQLNPGSCSLPSGLT